MNLVIDYGRKKDGRYHPYTQAELIAALVKENYQGLDIFKKIQAREEGDTQRITIEPLVGNNYNTKITFARIDKDGDVDDSSLEVFYYTRRDIQSVPVRGYSVIPPCTGGNMDKPVGYVIDNKYLCDVLTDMFYVEFKEENIEGLPITLTQKPVMELTLRIKDHPVYIGEVKLIVNSPEDKRAVLTNNFGKVTISASSTRTTVDAFLRAEGQYREPTPTERRRLQQENNAPIWLGVDNAG